MANNGFMNYSESNRCPICGKPDWCTYSQTNGSTQYICMRAKEYAKSDVFISPFDGREYECKGETSKRRNLFFYLKEDCDRWREEHKQKKKSGKRTEYKAVSKVIVSSSKADEIQPLSNDILNDIYGYMLDLLKLEDDDREYLYSEGFTDEIIEKYKIRTLPESDYFRYKNPDYKSSNLTRKEIAGKCLKFFKDLKGTPGLFETKDRNGKPTGHWDIAGSGGILFPLLDPYFNIYRLRVRVRRTDVGGKYRNLSSYQEGEDGKNQYLNGCKAGNNVGIYCGYDDKLEICFFTEGEKKAIIANEYFHYPVVNIPGINSYDKILNPFNSKYADGKCLLDVLKDWGTKIIIVAYDADKAVNDAVLANEQQTLKLLRENGFAIATAEWNMENGKGLDDLLKNGYTPRYRLYEG